MGDEIDWGRLIVHDDGLIGGVPAPAKPADNFDLASLYSQPPVPVVPSAARGGFLGRIAGMLASKFGASILVAVVFALFKEMALIRRAISFICAIVLGLLGWKVEPPKEEGAEAGRHIARVKELAGIPREDPGPTNRKPGFLGRLESNVVSRTIEPIKEKARDVKAQAIEKAEDIKETAAEVKDDAVEKVGEVKGEIKQKAGEVKDSIEAIGDRMAGGGQAPREEPSSAGASIRNGLGSLGQGLRGLANDPQGKQKGRPAGYNAQCPNCRKPMRIPASWHTMHACSGCGGSFDADDARRLGPPLLPGGFR